MKPILSSGNIPIRHNSSRTVTNPVNKQVIQQPLFEGLFDADEVVRCSEQDYQLLRRFAIRGGQAKFTREHYKQSTIRIGGEYLGSAEIRFQKKMQSLIGNDLIQQQFDAPSRRALPHTLFCHLMAPIDFEGLTAVTYSITEKGRRALLQHPRSS